MNFREVNKKFNELKQAETKALNNWSNAKCDSCAEYTALHQHHNALQNLINFRNTKISELHYLFK